MFDRPKRSLSFRREWTASAHAVASGIDVEGIWGLEVRDRPVAYMPRASMRDEAKRLQPWPDLSPRKGRPHAAGCFRATEGGIGRARETKVGSGKQAKRSHNAMRMLAGHFTTPNLHHPYHNNLESAGTRRPLFCA
jgi:hypothetical protein